MEYKPSNCLSNQLAIATVMAEEYNLTIDRQIKRDLVVDGVGWNFARLNQKESSLKELMQTWFILTRKTPL
jgi:hypothetical protein